MIGLSLLVLAVSPVTAPFSTCDLAELLAGHAAPGHGIVQVKPSPDESVPESCTAPDAAIPSGAFPLLAIGPAPAAAMRPVRHVPLRI